MDKTLSLAKELIAKPSVTPKDKDCQKILINRLKKMNFSITELPFGDVKNFWAVRGSSRPTLVFAGHTDVVPPGPLNNWTSDPFQPEVRDGRLYGRGAADMKSSLAAMITACERFVTAHPDHPGSISFLITSDEEGIAIDGTKKVVEYLISQHIEIDYCLVGEASSDQQFGDTIKNGRRGSLGGEITIKGTQGHIAYPHLSLNPIHAAATFIKEVCEIEWDQGNEYFPATSFQISNIHAGTGATNVIPGEMSIMFNFRYSTQVTAKELKNRINELLEKHDLEYDLSWQPTGEPFLTEPSEMSDKLIQAITDLTGVTPTLSTTGGTSDGRFIAKMGCQVLEFGPINASIHKIDEHVNVADLSKLSEVYERLLIQLLMHNS